MARPDAAISVIVRSGTPRPVNILWFVSGGIKLIGRRQSTVVVDALNPPTEIQVIWHSIRIRVANSKHSSGVYRLRICCHDSLFARRAEK